MGFSDFLANELIIARLVRAIKGLRCIDSQAFRKLAYASAGISRADADTFDAAAYRVEQIRRVAMAGKTEIAA